jgi:cytochrome oxidase Cu insertion factor (SCO1/SenC/PrrC family)
LASRKAALFGIIFCVAGALCVMPIFLKAGDAAFRGLTGPEPLPVLGTVPAFTLTDTRGEPLSLDQLTGKVWVTDFFFSRCGGPCPVMTGKFAELQQAFIDDDRIALVSVTVDPEYDTPTILSAFADEYGADPTRWHFLTGEKRDILELAVSGFMLAMGDDATFHSTRFALVDAQGRIRGYYDGVGETTVAEVTDAIRAVLDRG